MERICDREKLPVSALGVSSFSCMSEIRLWLYICNTTFIKKAIKHGYRYFVFFLFIVIVRIYSHFVAF